MSEKHYCKDCKHCYTYTYCCEKRLACKARHAEIQDVNYVTGEPIYKYKGYNINGYNNPYCKDFNSNGDCDLFAEKCAKPTTLLGKIKNFFNKEIL
jgi:hypothetical protein